MEIRNQLSVRVQSAGGDLAASVRASGDPLNGKSSAVILIHGYNNDQAQATGSYSKFLEDLSQVQITSARVPTPFGFFWPGDVSLKVISALSYPIQIGTALNAAERLYKYLAEIVGPAGSPISICIVGHSLGCRVVLELLKQFARSNRHTAVVINKVALMAAAVPVARVEDSGDLGNAAAFNRGTLVLFSEGDIVLHIAFPIGETLGGDGFFPRAVGRFGQPQGTWCARRAMETSKGSKYNHGDYWPGAEAASAVGQLLGVPVKASVQPNALSERGLPAPNQIGTHTLVERKLQERSL